MKSFGFTINLRNDDAAVKYKKYHEQVWSEIIGAGGALDTIGVLKMKIFFINPLTLFMYVESIDSFDPIADFGRALELDPRVQEWDDIMHGQLLTRLKENTGPMEWSVMEKVFSYEK